MSQVEPKWYVRHGDVLDVAADALVCPANVYLNLSGGVGGAFSLREEKGDASRY